MSRSSGEFVVSPLFYDALSGAFTPPTDPEGRQHTLGRLSYAAFSKGEFSIPPQTVAAPQYLKYNAIYRPSWAEMVEVTVGGVTDTNYNRLDYLQLENNAQSLVVISAARIGSTPSVYHLVRADGTDHGGPLTLGTDLDHARQAITDAAQTFFDQVQ